MRSVSLRLAPVRSAPVRSAPLRLASQRLVPVRSAPLRSAPARLAPVRLCPLRSVSLRSAPLKLASLSLASLRSVPQRLAPMRSATLRSASLRLAPARLAPSRLAPSRLNIEIRVIVSPLIPNCKTLLQDFQLLCVCHCYSHSSDYDDGADLMTAINSYIKYKQNASGKALQKHSAVIFLTSETGDNAVCFCLKIRGGRLYFPTPENSFKHSTPSLSNARTAVTDRGSL